ncbi:MAG: HAMP domain-containing protein [Balneolia bacterium]|nr:HAMP domain-containing protein [Balneolia bacterium]
MPEPAQTSYSNYLRIFSVIFGLLALIWVAGETHFYFGKPDIDEREKLTQQALEGAVNTFRDVEQDMIADTRRLRDIIQPLLGTDPDPTRIYNRIAAEKDFRGITVFRNTRQFAWTGNPITYLPALDTGDVYISVQQSGFVVYFVCQITFEGEDGTRYDIVSTRLIRRSGASPDLLTQQYDITRSWADRQVYPVNFRFFDINMAPVTARQVPLHTTSRDSVGFVTVSTADFPALERRWDRNMIWFRWCVVTAGIFILFGMSVLMLRRLARGGLFRPLLPAAFTLAIWLVLRQLEIPFPRLISESVGFTLSYQLLLLFDSVFIVFSALFVVEYLRRQTAENSGLLSGTVILLLAVGAGVAGAWAQMRLFDTIYTTQTGVIALRVFPALSTWIVYASSLLMLGSFISLLYMLSRSAIRQFDKPFFALLLLIPGLATGIGIVIYFDSASVPAALWVKFALLSILLVLLLGSARLNSLMLVAPVRPRAIAFTVFFAMILALPVYFDAEMKKENDNMLRMAVNYVTADEGEAEQITRQLIQSLLEEGVISQVQTVEASPSFPIQAAAQFRQQVSRQIDPDWGSYTILSFLLDGRLNIIADYGSQTSFTERFSTSFHDEVRSFIRQSLQRPFARLPIVESDNTFQGFPVFIKGLQSIPSDFPTQPSWLVTFVLVEGHSFGRPINDALAFHERERESWNRYVITQYRNNFKVSSTAALRTPVMSQYHILNDSRRPTAEQPTMVKRYGGQTPYRQLLHRYDDETTVMVTVRDTTMLNYIFTGFRFFVALLIICLIIYQLRKLYRTGTGSERERQSQRFQDRILDSYLIATLLFMIALAFITEYIVGLQNTRIAEQELYRNLSAVESRLDDHLMRAPRSSAIQLEDVDIMVFEDGQLTLTTAPEIFRLQLISDFIPFQAYNEIFNENRTTVFQPFRIGDLSVLMGFRAVFRNGQVERVLGIPAYTRSAIYEEEFLQTTTYLIAFYIIIFIFFTAIAYVVSRKLTQPLAEFESGLKRISSGNMDTTIPVTTNDEIGELARAYNQMVADLRNLRAELAEAERDAAWSEMARQIAHEIKNPLTPMKLSIQHLQRQMEIGDRSMDELRPAITKLTGMLVNQIESLNRIASDFSAFAKPLTGKQEKADLNQLISSTLPLFEHHQDVELHFAASPDPAWVHGVSDEIKRVLINLIKNGIEAMPEGGTIKITIKGNSGKHHVYISDSGDGIEATLQEKIFTPNFSTKTSGTGLGLAICKKIMEAHEGQINFSSSTKSGTTFELVFPAHHD